MSWHQNAREAIQTLDGSPFQIPTFSCAHGNQSKQPAADDFGGMERSAKNTYNLAFSLSPNWAKRLWSLTARACQTKRMVAAITPAWYSHVCIQSVDWSEGI
jgi:hypothetical protein